MCTIGSSKFTGHILVVSTEEGYEVVVANFDCFCCCWFSDGFSHLQYRPLNLKCAC